MPRVLSEHFGKVKSKLLEYSQHFDVADHGDIKGAGRETLVQEFLETHLPDQIAYLTGEILDEEDNRSGQVDIILLSKSSPKIPLLKNLHLAFCDSVIAVIEVKSNLTSQHLESTLQQFWKIKRLKRNVKISLGPQAAVLSSIPCIIFAFRGLSKSSIIDSINKFAKEMKIGLNEFCPDMVVVLDSDFYICKNDGWQFPVIPQRGAFFRDWSGLPHENLVGIYNYLNNIVRCYSNGQQVLPLGNYFLKRSQDERKS